jgi:hypothetical protein
VAPVAAPGFARHLVQERRPLRDQLAKPFKVVRPDGIDDLAGGDEPRPAGYAVAPRQRELRVRKRSGGGIRFSRNLVAEIRRGFRVASLDRAEQILGLVLELSEIGTNGQVTVRHDEPPLSMPGVRMDGREEVRANLLSRR